MSYKPERAETPSNGIPKAPRLCSVAGCTEDANVLCIVVREGSRERCGAFSDFGFQSGDNVSLRTSYEFVRWIARCWHHYERDLYAQRKGKWSAISGTSPDMTIAAVHAFADAGRNAT